MYNISGLVDRLIPIVTLCRYNFKWTCSARLSAQLPPSSFAPTPQRQLPSEWPYFTCLIHNICVAIIESEWYSGCTKHVLWLVMALIYNTKIYKHYWAFFTNMFHCKWILTSRVFLICVRNFLFKLSSKENKYFIFVVGIELNKKNTVFLFNTLHAIHYPDL